MHRSDYRVEPWTHGKLSATPTRSPNGVDEAEGLERVDELTSRLSELQNVLWADHSHRVLVVLQAIDGGGKDGTIRHVFGALNPQGVRVVNFKAPTAPELAHDYLWRVHPHVPGDGELTVFNRSHYGDVLVVRVHDLVAKHRWHARYAQIRHFEQMLVDEGTTIVKCFLHISNDEQRERLQRRIDTPDKQWKFNPADLAERARWDDYQAAFEDMLNETSTDAAPWYAIPADQKWYRNLAVAQLMVDTLESLDLSYPPPAEGVADTVVE